MAARLSTPDDCGPGVIWITGLSGAGKTTLSVALCDALRAGGQARVTLLDGEDVRRRLPRAYGHSLEDRAEVARHMIRLAGQEMRAGNLVVVAGISHQRWMRNLARRALGRFLEVYLDCPAEVCARRDVKGHYARACRGEEDCFIGVTHPYEMSRKPDLVLDTAGQSVEASVALLVEKARAFVALR